MTLPGGGGSVTYVHDVDEAEPWRAAGEVTGDPALVAAVEATMAGSLEHISLYGGWTDLRGWTEEHPTGLWETTPSWNWTPGDDETPQDMALCLVAVTPVGAVPCPELNLFLVGVLDEDDRLGREELLARGERRRGRCHSRRHVPDLRTERVAGCRLS